MVIKEKLLHAESDIATLTDDIWIRNRSVHLFSKGTARTWVCRNIKNPTLALLPDQRQVRDFYADAAALSLFEKINILPETGFGEDKIKTNAVKVTRGDVLKEFKTAGGFLLVTPTSLMAPFSFHDDSFEFRTGKEFSRSKLIDWLERKGYERNDIVWSPGQYVSRGAIIDIFSPSEKYPLRLEFFDDELESMRLFIPETQKSLQTLEKAAVHSLTAKEGFSLTDYFPQDMRVIFFDPKGLEGTAENAAWLWDNLNSEAEERVQYRSWEAIYAQLAQFQRIRITQEVSNSNIRLPLSPFPLFKGRLRDIKVYCDNLASEGYKIKIFSEAPSTLEWAAENNFGYEENTLSDGFIDAGERQIFISDLELSGAIMARRGTEHRAPSDWGAGLTKGQYVVHDDYGVAIYTGAETISGADGEQEYLVLQFAEERRLLIPVMHFFKISPWTPLPGHEPVLDNLKRSSWKKASEKAKENAEQAARELISIYAEREVVKGFGFAPSKELMRELESGFTYAETADQLKAIEDVENDMERNIPMDRLVVGDVGFGKTEVAIRAAGKAVFSGKQAAVMVPTTLLAQQHYDTFSSRFENMAVRVEVVSRFVPLSAQKKILKDLADGKVDILIGTHRLLTPDVEFKDLGLVIVDEEHRFGVMHKEHLKKIKPGVDVLMLSATPIPRSLSLSISGLRDLSILETPPQSRLPVITVVRPWSEELLKSAVLREINRGGQIFFVHNRINDIVERSTMLKRLFPKLRMAVAHSRMSEDLLEKTMRRFAAGGLDILICTTIVESGLDIPAANTLIVDDANELGLAQMYQLRGRVGRREEQAYAFLFYPNDARLTQEASERLEAIAQLDELGAGYQLAQRDLQIRGGGDIIGVAQHGNANRVGFQKYCDILAGEIAKLKGTAKARPEVAIGFPATIPGDYLPQENLRVTLYRRLLKADSAEEVAALFDETRDRFGKIPANLKFLFDTALLRASAPDLNVAKIIIGRDEIVMQGEPDGVWKEIVLPPRWFRRLDGFLGPGGIAGAASISGAVQKYFGLNLIQ